VSESVSGILEVTRMCSSQTVGHIIQLCFCQIEPVKVATSGLEVCTYLEKSSLYCHSMP